MSFSSRRIGSRSVGSRSIGSRNVGGEIVGSRRVGARSGVKPRARIRAFTSIGSEPAIMLTGPALVTQKLLRRAGMTVKDIDLFEVNEAFASVVLRFMQAFDVDADRVNVNGGSIAMGHPLGATGAIIIGTLLIIAIYLLANAAYLYVSPTIVRKCCRKDRRPISAELINEYGDL